ncbi:hypothetical protein Bca52824_032869 [Brassica carinata]|uniref:Uncharacterized protein n=1 Tax=Brassica carinata TaxID=52824 RepID=A0A8X7SDJ6_BRACI|nr:hypothetical protein Bca52824_032869 [Brassica carinata]
MEMKKADWEMKQADLERKERLSKLAILDTLLSKPGPLSEAEEDLQYEEKVVRLEKLFEDKVVRLERLVEESLAKKKSSVTDRFEVVVGVMLVVVVVIGVVMALK